nr:MAG TPA: hypothetical protein [Caudoviricetes sp.]
MLEKKIRRYKLMDAHRNLIREGKLLEGRLVLYLLRKGRISLGLGDEAWNVERLCEELGCRIICKRNGYIVEVRL